MARYAAALPKAAASTTLAVGVIQNPGAGTLRRIGIAEVTFGSEATPGDTALLWTLQRVTAAGAPAGGTAVTPEPLDPADPASVAAAVAARTTDPTIGAAQVLRIPVHQKATFRWQAAPGKDPKCPATASLGWAILTPTSTAIAVSATVHLEE